MNAFVEALKAYQGLPWGAESPFDEARYDNVERRATGDSSNCIGLIVRALRDCGYAALADKATPFVSLATPPDRQTIPTWCRDNLISVCRWHAAPGDILVFRFRGAPMRNKIDSITRSLSVCA